MGCYFWRIRNKPNHILQLCLTFQPNIFTETFSYGKQKDSKSAYLEISLWRFLTFQYFLTFNNLTKIILYWFFCLAFFYFFCYYLEILNRRRWWHPNAVLLPGKSHGRRSLMGCSPWGREESDTTEQLPFHFSLSCIGEGTGNPLQCSCLENPRDGGVWWAAVYGVAQTWIQLKWFSSLAVAEILKNNYSHRKLFTVDSISSSGIFCKTLVEVYFFFCLGSWWPEHCQ